MDIIDIFLAKKLGGGGGGSVTVDSALDEESENPVQNAVLYAAFAQGEEALLYKADKPHNHSATGTTASITAEDNSIYTYGELTSLTITDSAQNISFTVVFTSGATPTTLTVPTGYKAPGGDLTPQANKTYELNVCNGRAVLGEFEAVSS